VSGEDPGLPFANWILTLGVVLAVAFGAAVGAIVSFGSPSTAVLVAIVAVVFATGVIVARACARLESRATGVSTRRVFSRAIKTGFEWVLGLLPF
jgi:hypothetical protein